MDIAALMGASNVMPEQPGGVTPANGVDGEFKQILQGLISGANLPARPVTGDGKAAQPSNWLSMFLQLFDNSLTTTQTPDPTGEASQATESETTVSLTEIMTALQPLVNQSDTGALPHPAPDAPDTENNAPAQSTHPLLQAPTLAQLSALASPTVPVQPQVSAELESDIASTVQIAITTGNPAQNTPAPNGSPLPVPDAGSTGNGNAVLDTTAQAASPEANTAGRASALPNRAAPGATPAEPAAPATEQTQSAQPNTAPPDRTATYNPTPNPVSQPAPHPPSNPAAGATSTFRQQLQTQIAQPQSQPQTTTANADHPTPLAADVAPTPELTQGLPPVDAPVHRAAPQLPNVPALHQIVNSVKLIQQQGHSEVRLQLHPKELGQVLVQLHIADGDVSVQLLAENARAHALISEHLPQLKAALNAQGLQVSQANINLGNDASAFNAPGHHAADDQPNGFGFQQSQRHVVDDPSQPASAGRTKSGALGGLYSIDYQA